jgi:hypothetical protein
MHFAFDITEEEDYINNGLIKPIKAGPIHRAFIKSNCMNVNMC